MEVFGGGEEARSHSGLIREAGLGLNGYSWDLTDVCGILRGEKSWQEQSWDVYSFGIDAHVFAPHRFSMLVSR